jgi:class 3 adenylate cyclase
VNVARLRQSLGRAPAWASDALLAIAVAAATTIAIRVSPDFQGREPDLLAYTMAWAIGALLIVRRRWPLAVLVASFAILQAYLLTDYPGIWPAVSLSVALYTAAAAGHLRWALLIAAWFVLGPLVFGLLADPAPALFTITDVIRDASLWLAALFLGDAVRSRRAVQAERAKSERLLLNVLPRPIAERLKERDDVIADAFPDVTVLLADIVDFTPHAERDRPEQTVELLDDLFSTFDVLADARGLEKIKTMGDAYMLAGGLPEPMRDHAGAVAEMALEMREVAAGYILSDGQPVRLRIGVDSGPVVAGVIGRRKFTYDLWGDTVNTASRMEAYGVPGSIQVTQRVRDRLHGEYVFRERGRIRIKGKGEMVTYFLVGRIGERSPEEIDAVSRARHRSGAVTARSRRL